MYIVLLVDESPTVGSLAVHRRSVREYRNRMFVRFIALKTFL